MQPASTLRNVTLKQCVILAGGLATRLGDIARDTPKPVLPVGGHPFLYWPMREFLRFGVEEFVILAGHLAPAVEALVRDAAASLPRKVKLTFSVEPDRAGTGGALYHAQNLLDERFLMCNGDSLLAANLAPLLAGFAADDDGVLGRVMLRAVDDAQRYGVVTLASDVVENFAERAGAPGPGTINAGIYAFDRKIVDHLAPVCSLERDVLPKLARAGALRGGLGHGYFVDIGVPDDLVRAQTELAAALSRPALILDRDGVLNVDHGYVGRREDFAWVTGAQTAVRLATEAGWQVFVATNQSGIARGFYGEADLRHLMGWVADELRRAGGTLDDWRFCPFHPDATVDAYKRVSDWRKPAPGMLLDLLRAWDVPAARAVMVGDQDSDMLAAVAAGVRGVKFGGGDLAAVVAGIVGGGG